jgi:hypothetical protein
MKSCLLSHLAYQLDDILYATNYTSLICEDTRFHFFPRGCPLQMISWIINDLELEAPCLLNILNGFHYFKRSEQNMHLLDFGQRRFLRGPANQSA